MKKLALFVLALFLAAPAVAGERRCHTSQAAPIVSDWSVTGAHGAIVVDCKIAPRIEGQSLADTYLFRGGDPSRVWAVGMLVRAADSTGFWDLLDLGEAVVTDSTFHMEIPYPAGNYDYEAGVIGSEMAENDVCAEEFTGTFTIADPTPVRRVSFGEVLRKWDRKLRP